MTKLTLKEALKKAHILIIEDDIEYGNLLKEFIQCFGYTSQLARTGKEGLKLASTKNFDLTIVDNGLPDMTGVEVTIELQRLKKAFMILSGCDDPDIVKQTSATGAHAYLIKPVSQNQLFSTLEATLRRAEEMKQLRESSENLISSSNENRCISVATGILIEHLKLPEAMAHNRLRNKARNDQRKLSEVASELVAASELCNSKLEQYRLT